MKFKSHGVYQLEVCRRVLTVDATGPFNQELINAYRAELATCVAELSYQVWGQVVILHDESLFTPDAERDLIESLEYRKHRGLVACALVCDSDYLLVRRQAEKIYQTAGVNYDFFVCRQDANQWIERQITRVENS